MLGSMEWPHRHSMRPFLFGTGLPRRKQADALNRLPRLEGKAVLLPWPTEL